MSSDFPPVPPGQPMPQPQPASSGMSVGMILMIVFGVVGAMAVVFILLLIALLLPAIQAAREAARRNACTYNLRQIGIAVQMYHDAYGTFPPAYVVDDAGIPMHSWRALILPFLEDPVAQQIYEKYDFEQPWDSPHNAALADLMPAVYRCPSSDETENTTNYLAVVGNETMWPHAASTKVKTIAVNDGTSNTIAVVESSGSGVTWLEPTDLTFDEACQGINKVASRPGIKSHHRGGANVLFADGSVHYLADDISPDVLRALLTVAGQEEVQAGAYMY